MLDRERTIAPPGYRRWLIPPAALAVHLSIGQVYAFSVFKEPLVEHFDTKLTPISIIFSIAIVMLGLSAAIGGTWVERSGPRKAMFVAGLCWSAGFFVCAARRRHRPAVARLPRLRRDRRHRPGHRLHLAGLDADQVVPGPPGPRDRPGDHGLRRRRARRLPRARSRTRSAGEVRRQHRGVVRHARRDLSRDDDARRVHRAPPGRRLEAGRDGTPRRRPSASSSRAGT